MQIVNQLCKSLLIPRLSLVSREIFVIMWRVKFLVLERFQQVFCVYFSANAFLAILQSPWETT